MKEIKGFRLMTGELVVATIDSTELEGVIPQNQAVPLQEPIAYVMANDPQGRQSLMPVPFVAKRCWLYLTAVVAEVTEEFIQDEILQHYRSVTGTGLVLAKTLPTRKT